MRKILVLFGLLFLALFTPQTIYAFNGKVGTYFFHWYRCPDDPNPDPHSPGVNACDVSNLKIRNIASGMRLDDPYPEGGYYHWDNLNWYKRQFTDMVYAGITDIFPVDFYAVNQVELMGRAVSELNLPLKIGFFWDPPTESTVIDLSTSAGKEQVYASIRSHFLDLPRDLWSTVDGRPVIFTVYVEGNKDLNHWEAGRDLFVYFKQKFQQDFGVTPWLVVERSWWNYSDLSGVADGKYGWAAALDGIRTDTVNGYKVSGVGPGLDGRTTPWAGDPPPYRDREDGEFLRRELNKVPSDTSLLMIETWNELFENTGIGRAINYKRTNGEDLPQEYYMDILRNSLGLTDRARIKNASLEFTSCPFYVYVGEVFEVRVRATNSGLVYWSEKDKYRLGIVGDDLTWGTGRFFLEGNEVVFPIESKEFMISLTAPRTEDVRNLSLRMLQDDVEWFGQTTSCNINVISRINLKSGWNKIVWPNITGKTIADLPSVCKEESGIQNGWFWPFAKEFISEVRLFIPGQSYLIKCNLPINWQW